jgi:GT2 family glycosyltransferase
MSSRISVVMITRNRATEAAEAARRLRRLPERPRILVVDNGSRDDTVARLRAMGGIDVVPLPANLGAAARNTGVRRVDTDYVAFADDDCWWEPGSLATAVRLFDAAPRLAVATARVLVEPGHREDPACTTMARSPLPTEPGLPGVPVLGFLAGACVVRRSAFLSVGGFEPRYFLGGEEELVAIDLTARGWRLAYVPGLTAHHAPSAHRDPVRRTRLQLRNALWSAWLRRPLADAAAHTYRLLSPVSVTERLAAGAAAVRALWWVSRNRRVVPPDIARLLQLRDVAEETGGPA